MNFAHSFFIVANNVSGAEKRFFNAFKASENSMLIINERMYELYINSKLLNPYLLAGRILVLKEGKLLHFLYRQLYVPRRLKTVYILLQRFIVLRSLRKNKPALQHITTLHAVLDGVRYIPYIRYLHPDMRCFASVVDPTLEFSKHKARLFGLQNCHHIDSLNFNIKTRLMKLGFDENRLSITPNTFTDYDRIQPVPKKKQVIFCARLVKPKNPLVFTDIANCFVKNYPGSGVQFIIMGDGPLKASIDDRLARNPELQQHLRATGYVADPVNKLAESLIFVQLSDTEIHATQSMLEAMGAGCYILVSHLEGIEKVVRPEFGEILPLDAAVFAGRIKHLTEQASQTEEAGKAARAFALENFHVKHFLAYLFGLYPKAESLNIKSPLSKIINMVLFK